MNRYKVLINSSLLLGYNFIKNAIECHVRVDVQFESESNELTV